jgi:type III restriction enzyme
LQKIQKLLIDKDPVYYNVLKTTTRSGLDGDDNTNVVSDIGVSYVGQKLLFNQWINDLTKKSFVAKKFNSNEIEILKSIYKIITDNHQLKQEYELETINLDILKSFLPTVKSIILEKIEEQKVNWLITDIESKEYTLPQSYPQDINDISKIQDLDSKNITGIVDPTKEKEIKASIDQLRNTMGDLWNEDIGKQMLQSIKPSRAVIHKESTLHYMPYQFDSSVSKVNLNELTFFESVLGSQMLKDKNFEIYFNGNKAVSNFKITIYKKSNGSWILHQQNYTPDFLIIKRDKKSKIDKVLIVEIKGGIYADKFVEIREFMETKFVEDNSDFEYLYLEDSQPLDYALAKLKDKINIIFSDTPIQQNIF